MTKKQQLIITNVNIHTFNTGQVLLSNVKTVNKILGLNLKGKSNNLTLKHCYTILHKLTKGLKSTYTNTTKTPTSTLKNYGYNLGYVTLSRYKNRYVVVTNSKLLNNSK